MKNVSFLYFFYIWFSRDPTFAAKNNDNNNNIRKGLGIGTLNTCCVCKTSGSISQKQRGHSTLQEFGAISLHQPVEVLGIAPPPERAAQAIRCLRVDCRGHVRRPLVGDNLAGGSCVLWRCASALCEGIWGRVVSIPHENDFPFQYK